MTKEGQIVKLQHLQMLLHLQHRGRLQTDQHHKQGACKAAGDARGATGNAGTEADDERVLKKG